MKRFFKPVIIFSFLSVISIQPFIDGACSCCGGDKQSGNQWAINSNHGVVNKKSGNIAVNIAQKGLMQLIVTIADIKII